MQRRLFLTLAILLAAMVFSITAAAQQRFSVSLNGRQQVPPVNSPGNGDCAIALNATETQFTITCNYRNLTSNVQQAHIHDVTGPIRFDLTFNGGTSGIIGPRTFNASPAQIANLRSNRYYVNIHTVNFPAGEIRGQIKRANVPYDYDGDGRTDIVVHRRSATTIYTLNSLENNVTADLFGVGTGDNFVNNIPGDFDGDGRADFVLIRVANGVITWIILQSGTNTYRIERFGGGSDAITPSDYDGDGKLDIAVFRRPTGVWYILESSTGVARAVPNFGAPNDLPVVGDYDGDGKADLCVVRNEGGTLAWWILNSSTGQAEKFLWGVAGSDSIFFFFQIDVDGDGKQDLMVQRNVGGQLVYFVRRSSDGEQYAITWGSASFFPLFGDYDGDGKTDFVNRQVVNGQYYWYIFQSATQTTRVEYFGASGDQRPEGQGPGEPETDLPVSSGVF